MENYSAYAIAGIAVLGAIGAVMAKFYGVIRTKERLEELNEHEAKENKLEMKTR